MAENEIRIKDLPLAQQIEEDDDVIVLDNATDGTRKLQGKVLLDMIHSAMAKGTASGAIARFTDGADNIPMTDLVVSIEPQQDLHGYDAPWVGGAGKNKLNFNTATTTHNGVTYTNNNGVITATNTSTGYSFFDSPFVTLPAGSYKINGNNSDNGLMYIYDSNNTNIGSVAKGTDTTLTFESTKSIKVRILYTEGKSGNGDKWYPMIRLASVTDSTFAPYENICPLSGWTACNVVRTGKNLFDKDSASLNKALGWNTGTEFAENNSWVSGFISVKPSVSYKCNKTISQLFGYDESKTCVAVYRNGEWVTPTSSFDVTSAFTVPSYIKYIRFSRRNTSGASADVADAQLEIDTQSTTYEEYNGNTYTINFVDGSSPLTVYKGELDVLSGLLKAYPHYDSYNGETINGEWISDRDAYSVGATPTIGAEVQVISGSDYTTYQQTANNVKSLEGVNNIFADTGNILNAEYVRDTTTIINQILARLDALES